MKKAALPLIALSFLGCTQSQRTVVDFADNQVRLSADTTLSIEGVPAPLAIYWDGKEYICLQKADECLVAIDPSLSSYQFIGMKGHSQTEWLAPYLTKQSSGGSFYVLERPTSVIYAVDGKGGKKEAFRFPQEASLRYAFQTADGNWIGAVDDEDCKTFVYDASSKSVDYKGHPLSDENIPEEFAQAVMQTQAVYNSKTGRLAQCYYSFPLLVIRDKDGEIVSQLEIEPFSTLQGSDFEHTYCNDIEADENYIYVLYDFSNTETSDIILLFDWDGNPVEAYRIDPATAFTVNAQEKKIVAINEDDSNGAFSIYTMP